MAITESGSDENLKQAIAIIETIIRRKQAQLGPQGTLSQLKAELIQKINNLKADLEQLRQRMAVFSPGDRSKVSAVENKLLSLEGAIIHALDQNYNYSLAIIRHLENALQYHHNFNTFSLANQEENNARHLLLEQAEVEREIARLSSELETYMRVVDKLLSLYSRQAAELAVSATRLRRAA